MESGESRKLDPAALALPSESPVVEHSFDLVEAAYAQSGIESEFEHVRGGDWITLDDPFLTSGYWKNQLKTTLGPELFLWPPSLYIPRQADWRDYWFVPAPDRQRYTHAWPTGTGQPNHASADTGELFAYTIVDPQRPGVGTQSEAGIGITYSPDFTLGVVDFEPVVNVKDGLLTTALEYHPILSAGHVTLTASLLLASWQIIPGGFDLLAYRSFRLAQVTRDQSHGPERTPLPGSLVAPGRRFSAPFVVQKGREYLFGAIGRVTITSTLTDTQGRPLTGTDNRNFKVYAWMTLVFPSMSVRTSRIDIR